VFFLFSHALAHNRFIRDTSVAYRDGKVVPDDDPTTTSAPHDLTPSERVRLATEMLTGFRWCRLALGLYLRGLTPDSRNTIGRWPSQMSELKQLQDVSQIEGFAPGTFCPLL
jgi:hypothetical protein